MDFGMLSFGLEHFLIKINWPKIGIFLGLGFSSTFGPPPPPYFPGVPTLVSNVLVIDTRKLPDQDPCIARQAHYE